MFPQMKKKNGVTFEDFCASQTRIFGALARFYGWDLLKISNMTMEQIKIACDAIENAQEPEDTGEAGSDRLLHFSTLEQLQLWRESRG